MAHRLSASGLAAAAADQSDADILRQELRALGYVEGHNLVIEYRWGEGSQERLREFASDLVKREVAVIIAPNNPAIIAAKHATTTIPIVTAVAVDPVGQGFIASFAKPDWFVLLLLSLLARRAQRHAAGSLPQSGA